MLGTGYFFHFHITPLPLLESATNSWMTKIYHPLVEGGKRGRKNEATKLIKKKKKIAKEKKNNNRAVSGLPSTLNAQDMQTYIDLFRKKKRINSFALLVHKHPQHFCL